MTKTNLGFLTTFMMTLDYQEKTNTSLIIARNTKQKSDMTSEKSETKGKDMSKVCFACGENGNYANKRPTRQNNKEEDEERSAHLTWNVNIYDWRYPNPSQSSGESLEKKHKQKLIHEYSNTQKLKILKRSLLYYTFMYTTFRFFFNDILYYYCWTHCQ